MEYADNRDVRTYFEQMIKPLIEEHYPDVAAQMCVQVNDESGVDIPDPLAIPDMTIYLEDRLWSARGGQVQLLLETSLDVPREIEGLDGTRHCVGVWVHPLSWLRELRRFLDTRAEAGADLPWEEVTIERFFEVQNQLILHDPHGILRHLREATRADLFPRWLWDKHLVVGLRELMEDLRECRRMLRKGRMLELSIAAPAVLEAAMHLGFVIHRSYYPPREILRWAFEKLPSPAPDVLVHLDAAVVSPDPLERIVSLEAVRDIYVDYVADSDLLPTLELRSPKMGLGDLDAWEELHQELLWAWRCEAWSNPNWRAWVTRCQRDAAEDGHGVVQPAGNVNVPIVSADGCRRGDIEPVNGVALAVGSAVEEGLDERQFTTERVAGIH